MSERSRCEGDGVQVRKLLVAPKEIFLGNSSTISQDLIFFFDALLSWNDPRGLSCTQGDMYLTQYHSSYVL